MKNIDTNEYADRFEYLKSVSRNAGNLTGRKIRIIYKPNKKLYPNASAYPLIKNTAIISGDWGDFTTDPVEKMKLLFTIGHELGHLDHSPMYMSSMLSVILVSSIEVFLIFLSMERRTPCIIMAVVTLILMYLYHYCKVNSLYLNTFGAKWNKLCEHRADYCGLIFASEYLQKYEPESFTGKDDIINASTSEDALYSDDRDHPMYVLRSDYLLNYPVLNEDTLRSMCDCHNLKEPGNKILKRFFYRGKMFDLKSNSIIKS